MGIPFGKYELVRKIASGGMGQVLLARKGEPGFEKLVVLKRILPHLVEDDEFFEMFLDEAKVTMRLDHPNIARINEFGEQGGVHYIEMEYVAGEDLRRIEKRARSALQAIPLGVVLRITGDAAAGLDFAHKARDSKGQPLGIVHRDVSPQNILVGFDGSVKLIDFGVAKAAGRAQHTATGVLKGKFPYMSPEQAAGLEVDGRSDVFALGIVLWEVLTGRRLFKADSDTATQRAVLECKVPTPSSVAPALPADLDPLVMRALARDRQDRYPDAMAFRLAVEDYARTHQLEASSVHVVTWMAELFAERIAREADPRALEEDSGLTDLDSGGLSRSGSGVVSRSQAAPRTTVSAPPVAPAGRSPLLFGGVVLAGLVVAALVGTALFRPGESPALPPPVAAPVAAPVVAPLVAPRVTVTSEPPGASFTVGGVAMKTPAEVELPGGAPLQVTLALEGHESREVTLSADRPTQAVTLVKKARARPAGPGEARPKENIKLSR